MKEHDNHYNMSNYIVCVLIGLLKIYLVYLISTKVGIIPSFIICFLTTKLYRYLLNVFLGLESLSSTDMIYIGKTPNEKFNLMGILIFHNTYDSQALNEFVINLIKKVKKFRSKLIFKFFNYYWKEVDLEIALKRIKNFPTVYQSEEEFFEKYVKKELNSFINVFEELPFEISLVKFGEKSGAIVLKIDHCMSDALGIISTVCCLSDNYNANIFPKIMQSRNIPWYKYYLLDIISFFYFAPIALKRTIFIKSPPTPIRTSKDNSGRSKFAVGKLFPMKKFDRIKQELGISFNDFMLSVISFSIKQFFNKIDSENNIKDVFIMIPIGTKGVPKSEKELKVKNQVNGVFLNLPLIDDIKKDAKKISKASQTAIRNSGFSTSLVRIGEVLNEFLPLQHVHRLGMNMAVNFDATISNLPGPVVPIYFNGCKVTQMCPIISSHNVSSFMPVITYDKHFRILYTITEELNYHPKELLDIIDNVLNKFEENN